MLKKHKFTPDYILSKIDFNRLSNICEQFKGGPSEGLDRVDFINLMCKVVKHELPIDQYDLVSGLLQLFKEVDINDDKFMEFDEFATYLIEAVEARKLSAK